MPKFNPPKFIEHVNSYALKKNHVMSNSNVRSKSKIICNYCDKCDHHITNCYVQKNPRMVKPVWIPKHILESVTNMQGPKLN